MVTVAVVAARRLQRLQQWQRWRWWTTIGSESGQAMRVSTVALQHAMAEADGKQQRNNHPTKKSAKAGAGGGFRQQNWQQRQWQ